jgi:hypothetical protein
MGEQRTDGAAPAVPEAVMRSQWLWQVLHRSRFDSQHWGVMPTRRRSKCDPHSRLRHRTVDFVVWLWGGSPIPFIGQGSEKFLAQ